jgi:hypothetical protein
MRMLNYGFLGFVLIAMLGDGTGAHASSRPRVDQTVALGTLRHSAGYPKLGSSVVFAGTVSSLLGRGTIVLTVTVTGHPTSAVFMLRGTSTAFYPHGTTRGAFTGTGTLTRGGRFALVGHGLYTSGGLYRDVQRHYSFTGTAPSPPSPPTPACAVPAGSQVVASDAEVVVIMTSQDYRYCDYAEPSRGFQRLINTERTEGCAIIGTPAECAQIDGVALSYILYHTWTAGDSPACGGPNPVTDGSSTVYGVDATSGKTVTLAQGGGGIASAGLSAPGVAAWILTYQQCTFPAPGPGERTETLGAYSFRTGAVTTLDTGDPGEMASSPPSLANLQLYQCASGCSDSTAVVAWTHDGTWRYEQVG